MPGRSSVTYTGLTVADAGQAGARALSAARSGAPRCRSSGRRAWTGLLLDDGRFGPVAGRLRRLAAEPADEQAFFDRQVHIAMEHYGRLDPLDLDEYLAHEGFVALRKCLEHRRHCRLLA